MASLDKQNAVSPRSSPPASSRVSLYSPHDLFIVLLFAPILFFTGLLLALSAFSSLTLVQLLLFAAFVVLCPFGILILLRQRAAAHQAALDKELEQSQAIAQNLRAEIRELEDENQQLRDKADALSEKLVTRKEPSATRSFPVVRPWGLLRGEPGGEIETQLAIITELFQGQEYVEIKKRFSGGHRNRGVYLVRSSFEVERVVKIARTADIRAERNAQELINRFSHHNGGQRDRDLLGASADDLGGIVYRLAGLRRAARVTNFGDFYREQSDPNESAAVIEQLFAYVLPHSQFRKVQTMPVVQATALPQSALDEIWNCVQDLKPLAHASRTAERTRVNLAAASRTLRNPIHWAQTILPTHRELEMPVYVGVIHGDLHSGNLLIELPEPSLWMIDFAKTRDNALTLCDFAKLEADIKFYLLPGVGDLTYFEQALAFEEHWTSPRRVQDFALPASAFSAFAPAFAKAGASIASLRHMALHQHLPDRADIVGHFATDSLLPYYLALLPATLRALTYEQCSETQKVYAFVAASLLCERIDQLLS